MQPTRQLFRITLFMDLVALALGLCISPVFVLGLAVYILASRAYSYRGIRLKKYPLIGYLTVISCQGALVFFLVFYGSHRDLQNAWEVPVEAMVISSLLIGGFYPLTQLYQHEADRLDGVKTLSLLLGYKGSFIFAGIIYLIAFLLLAHYFVFTYFSIKELSVLATCMLPILVYFFIWAAKVWKDPAQANFTNTMRMNILGSLCTNLGFIAVLVMN